MAVLLVSVRPAQAQWQTQSFVIKPGWTAIYLHVDPSYTNLDYLIGSDPNNPIDQILLWIPAGTVQYVSSPQNALTASSGWAKWQRLSTSTPNSLANLIPNAAYLVHSTAAQNYNWNVKGRPVAPNYIWQASGLNLVDFPTVTNNPPLLDDFLSVAPGFQNNIIDIYQYLGGDLGPLNPSPVWNPHGTQVTRGTAFWLRSGTYFNTYFGPFTVGIVGGLEFSNLSSTLSFHLKNTTPNPVTVTLNLAPSETSPAGQKPILGLPWGGWQDLPGKIAPRTMSPT